DDDTDSPVAVGHVGGRVGDHDERPAGNIDAIDVAVVDLEGQREPAIVASGRLMSEVRPRARTNRVARTVLVEITLQLPAHLLSSAGASGTELHATPGGGLNSTLPATWPAVKRWKQHRAEPAMR